MYVAAWSAFLRACARPGSSGPRPAPTMESGNQFLLPSEERAGRGEGRCCALRDLAQMAFTLSANRQANTEVFSGSPAAPPDRP